MRLLTLAKRYPVRGSRSYGAEAICRGIVRHLAAAGHEVTVVTSTLCAGDPQEEVRLCPRLILDRPDPRLQPEQWGAREKWQFLRKARHNYLVTRQALRELQPDVVYFSDLELLTGSPITAVQESGVPMVFHAHDYTLLGMISGAWATGHRGARRDELRRAGLDWFLHPSRDREAILSSPLLAVSEFIADQYRAAGWHSEQIRVVANGIGEEFFQGGPRECPAALSAVLAGRLVPDKGVHVAVEAIGMLAKLGLRVELHLLGEFSDEEYRGQIERLATDGGVSQQVKFRGYVPPEEMPREYRRHACAVVPTLEREAFGLVSVEAQASGTPVIVSRVGGLPETVREGETGLVVPPGDAAALATALERVLTNREQWLRMSEAGREFARSDFRIARVVREVEEILAESARGERK